MLLPDDWPVGDALSTTWPSPTTCSSSRSRRTGPTARTFTASPARSRRRSTRISRHGRGPSLRPRAPARPTTTSPRGSTLPICARAGPAGCSPTSRWARRRPGSRPASPQPACARSRTSSTSRTTSCSRSASPPTRSTSTRSPGARSSSAGRPTGEPVTTLDGQARTLDPDVLVIADAERPSAIAGLMGAEWSEVTDETTTVLLECANFDGPSTQRSSIRLGLRTEGSSRWEKGLDPHLPPRALALASQLHGRAHGRPARARARSTCTARCPSSRWSGCAGSGWRP